MDDHAHVEELLTFFKALSDANRLKIVAILAEESHSVEELAAMLDLSSSTVSHHLSKLSKIGLVSARAEGYYNVYELQLQALNDMARRFLSEETLSAVASDVDMAAYDRKVLDTFMSPEGRLLQFPAQRKKEEAILHYIAREFEPGQRYGEKEVNLVLSKYHEDTARLRRNLVEFGFMEREGGGGDYWLVQEEDEP